MREHFLYFIETPSGIITRDTAEELLKDTGLEKVLPMDRFVCAKMASGIKDANAGLLFCSLPACCDDDPEVKYEPKEQTWVKVEAKRPYWIGVWEEDLPCEEHLRRIEQIPGHGVLLANEYWKIPLVRLHEGGTMLPEKIGRNASGEMVRTPLQRFAKLSEIAEDLYGNVVDAVKNDRPNFTIGFEKLLGIAEEALNLNYHVGPHEISLLDLIDTSNISFIGGAMVDVQKVLEEMNEGLEGNELDPKEETTGE